ncbi:SDR family NAD(P)-dependent oxidoreductase [Pseudopedobacter sp.]|uniref:SDR family oxidoreductase n=1 Tax=Pseudopedobacter sp. TaxID=1936787 RepID=UPI0033427483
MKLNNNKILITGATSGIGKALTEKLCKLDNQVIAVGRNMEMLDTLAKSDNRIITFQCDLSSETEINHLVSFIKQNHSDLNILINNAAIQYNCRFDEATYSAEKIENEININLIAPIKLSFYLLPILRVNCNAAIVNISSALGIVPKAISSVYCGTKAAIHIYTKSLRYQLEDVKVFEVIPPLVDTEMTKGRGKNKISTKKLVDEFIKAFRNNKYEINIHKVKLLRILNRISPKIADKIMKRTTL